MVPLGRALLKSYACLIVFWVASCSEAGEVQSGIKSYEGRCSNSIVSHSDELIAGGRVQLGDTRDYSDEGPIHFIDVDPFRMDKVEVTNAQFTEFVSQTGYVTRAERGLPEDKFAHLPDKMRLPGSAVFSPSGASRASLWAFVEKASWKAPAGPGSNIDGKENYPVVHVVLEDAIAYAEWAGRRIPTEAEWETAARGHRVGQRFSWGSTPPAELSDALANTWQGLFPVADTGSDGFMGLAPVGCFPEDDFGLHDMIGNVWEWTADVYSPARKSVLRDASERVVELSSFEQQGVLKGGSYLCAESFCYRFRPAARQAQDLTIGASHIGFRTVVDAPDAQLE